MANLAADSAAPFNLDLTVTNIPGHSPSCPNDQSLSGDQFAVKGALNIGIFSRAFAIEDAPLLDDHIRAVGQLRFDVLL